MTKIFANDIKKIKIYNLDKHLIIKYEQWCAKIGLVDSKISWYDDFLGVGYHFYDVRPKILLIFDERKKIPTIWNNVIKYWPDDEIKIRFVEMDDSFEFILYCESRVLLVTWVFLKSLKTSDNYKRFKDDYDGAANFGLALYKPKDDSYELEIFKYKKRITDLKFLTESEAELDFIVSRSRKILNDTKESQN